jgi:hypothetical protein
MATAPTAGNIYLIESDATDNADWVTVSGDPDTIDLDLYVEGNEYCKLEMPQQFKKNFSTGIVVTDGSGGISFERRWEKRSYTIALRGISTTRANGDLVERFLTIPRHTSGTVATYKTYYLIFYFGVNDHNPFTDSAGARQSYCKGVATIGSMLWVQSNPHRYTIDLNWRSVW